MTLTTMSHEELCKMVLELKAEISELKLSNSPKRSSKAPKKDRLDDPSMASCVEDLTKATINTLKMYLKENELKTSGKKDELVERAWKLHNNTVSESDKSPKNRPKKEKPRKEKHACCCLNKQGEPCSMPATKTHELDGEEKWYCWKHDPSISSEEEESSKDDASNNSEPSEEIEESPKPKKKVVKKKVKKTTPPEQMEEEE